MDSLALTFFPYPYIFKGERKQGSLLSWTAACSRCDRQCETATVSGIAQCSWGVNYWRIDNEFLVFGIVLRDTSNSTPARRKRLKRATNQPTRRELEHVVSLGGRATTAAAAELAAGRQAILDEYRRSGLYKTDLLQLLRPDIQKALGQLHDYKSFVAQVVQNLAVLWNERYGPDVDVEDQMQLAPKEEVAIYHAARLMEDRIDAALFLTYPERITDLKQRSSFRLHGLVHKTLRIYEAAFAAKGVRCHEPGESFGLVEANYRALAVIPHTLLDNALKYAPRDSDVYIAITETDQFLNLSVRSLGPKIYDDEIRSIFELFYRGREAQDVEGTGFGLALADNIAHHIGTTIEVQQESNEVFAGRYWTCFSIRFARSYEDDGLVQVRRSRLPQSARPK